MKKAKKFMATLLIAMFAMAAFTVTASAANVQYKTTTTKSSSTTTLSSKATKTQTKTSTSTKTYTKTGSSVYNGTSSMGGSITYKWTYTLKRVTTTAKKYTKGSKTVKVTKTVKDYYYTDMDRLTPKAPTLAHNAFNKIGFTLKFVSNASYQGNTNCTSRTVSLKEPAHYAYHELGHVVAFVAGNVDYTSEWAAIYNAEKSKYVDYNKGYVCSSAQEYFAGSFEDYCLRPSILKSQRPKTYTFVANAVAKCTDAQISRILSVYSAVWK